MCLTIGKEVITLLYEIVLGKIKRIMSQFHSVVDEFDTLF